MKQPQEDLPPFALDIARLADGARAYGITLDADRIALLERYARMVAEWSPRMNLVSRRDLGRFLDYHLLDSLKAASVIDFTACTSMLDFGSGAGLPGVPLAIAFPELAVTLVDSRLKQCTFLTAVRDEIPLPGLSVVRSRIEDLPIARNKSFDCVLTRATVHLAPFVSLAGRFVRPGGKLVAWKGDAIDNEYRALKRSGAAKVFNMLCTTPTPFDGVRTGHIVVISRAKLST